MTNWQEKQTKTVIGLTVVAFVSDRMDITHDRYLYMSNFKKKTLRLQAEPVYKKTKRYRGIFKQNKNTICILQPRFTLHMTKVVQYRKTCIDRFIISLEMNKNSAFTGPAKSERFPR